MDLLNEDGRLDYDKAARELNAAHAVHDRNARRDILATLQTSALLDIADSLRVLAVESALALSNAGALNASNDDDDEAMQRQAVAVIDAPAGSIVGILDPHGDVVVGKLTGNSGMDQGEPWVEVETDDAVGTFRAWVHAVVSVQYPEDVDTAPLVIEPAEPVNPVADVDDLDHDFDGDDHTAATDAAAELAARERKAKAKGKGKGKR